MKRAAWILDEKTHAGEEHLDVEYASSYDRKAATDPAEDVARLRDLGLDQTSTVVDVGAGTGTFAIAVAPFCKRVIAIDISLAMIGLLRNKTGANGITNIEPTVAGFLSYEHHGAPADFIYSRNALHHLPDFWKAVALRRVATILRRGGILLLRDLVFSFELDDVEPAIEAWLDGASDDSLHGWTRSELEAHIRDEHSTFDWLLRAMLDRAGFRIDSAEYRASRTYAAYLCVRV